MPKPLIIFDLDGTLVDSSGDLSTAVNLTRADYGLPALSRETVVTFIGNGLHKLMERSFDGADVDVDEAIPKMRAHYDEHMVDTTALYPGVSAALESLRDQGYALAVVTNKPVKPAQRICRELGIDAYFPVVLGGDSCPNIKPHPEPLHWALELTECGTEGSWMVGDNYTDMEAGKNAGLSRCFCTYGLGFAGDSGSELAVDNLAKFAQHVASEQ